MKRLRILDASSNVIDQAGYDNCLACHNTTRRYDEPRAPATPRQTFVSLPNGKQSTCLNHQGERPADTNSFLREGVGCAGCHGPSQQWIGNHFQYDWNAAAAVDRGFVHNSDLFVRAAACAICHIGGKDRDMNHDIIAAGHPPLRYELATFHAWQPKHWRDAEAGQTDRYETQLWLAGQFANVDAALSLLQTRSTDAHTVSQWPELSAYDCASCHQNIRIDPEIRQRTTRPNAIVRYSQWNHVGLIWFLNWFERSNLGVGSTETLELVSTLEQLETAMQLSTVPDRELVRAIATDARRRLAAWLAGPSGQAAKIGFRSGDLANMVAGVVARRDAFATWESSVQFYLAAVACRDAWPTSWSGPASSNGSSGWNGPALEPSRQLRQQLRFDGSSANITKLDSSIRRSAVKLALQLGPVDSSALGDTPRMGGTMDPIAEAKQFEATIEQLRQRIERSVPEQRKRLKEIYDRAVAEQAQPEDTSPNMRDDLMDTTDEPARAPKPKLTPEQIRQQLREKFGLEKSDE